LIREGAAGADTWRPPYQAGATKAIGKQEPESGLSPDAGLRPLRSEARAAGEAERLRNVVARFRCHERIVEADWPKRRCPEDRGTDRRTELLLVGEGDTAALSEIRWCLRRDEW